MEKELPKRVKKRRQIQTEEGLDAGWEEYYDYIFPSDEGNQANLKLLALAKMWKQKKAEDVPEQMDKPPGKESAEVENEPEKEKERQGDSDTDIEESDSEDEADEKT